MPQFTLFYVDLTDTVLKDDDLNDNGYLTYVEYKLSQAIRAAKEKLEEYVDALWNTQKSNREEHNGYIGWTVAL